MGWFFGFNSHIVFNHQREIVALKLTKSVIKFGDSGIRFNFNPELLFFQIMKTTDELVNHAERQLYYI